MIKKYDIASRRKATKAIVRYLEQQSNAIKTSGASPEFLDAYQGLVEYLKLKSPEYLLEAFYKAPPINDASEQGVLFDADDSKIREMPIEEISTIISNPAISRRELEKIARIRFGVPKGALSSLSNKKLIIEKILSLVSNELGHHSIQRIVRKFTSTSRD